MGCWKKKLAGLITIKYEPAQSLSKSNTTLIEQTKKRRATAPSLISSLLGPLSLQRKKKAPTLCLSSHNGHYLTSQPLQEHRNNHHENKLTDLRLTWSLLTRLSFIFYNFLPLSWLWSEHALSTKLTLTNSLSWHKMLMLKEPLTLTTSTSHHFSLYFYFRCSLISTRC